MITLLLALIIIMSLPRDIKKVEEKEKERKQKEELQRIIRQESKYGKRWG